MSGIKYALPPDAYTPAGISYYKAATVEQGRAEYKRLRNIAQQRLRRIARSEFGKGKTAPNNVNRFKPLSEIKSEKELSTALSDIRRFLDAQRSSVSGLKELRQRSIDTLHEHGYYMVNEENYDSWGKYMEAVKMRAGTDHVIGSPPGEVTETATDLFEAAEAKGIPAEEIVKDWDYWVKNVENLKETKRSRKENAGAKDYKRNIKARQKRQAEKAAAYQETRSRVLKHNAAQHNKMRRKG